MPGTCHKGYTALQNILLELGRPQFPSFYTPKQCSELFNIAVTPVPIATKVAAHLFAVGSAKMLLYASYQWRYTLRASSSCTVSRDSGVVNRTLKLGAPWCSSLSSLPFTLNGTLLFHYCRRSASSRRSMYDVDTLKGYMRIFYSTTASACWLDLDKQSVSEWHSFINN